MSFSTRHGILFILSGPSGAGKTTLLESLDATRDFEYSVSCTTRAPRPGEVDGEDYHFMTEAEFRERLDRNEFLEHAQVHGNHYGTLRDAVMGNLSKGVDVLLDIDIQGAAMVRAYGGGEFRSHIADVFITPPGIDVLRARLKKRATETEESLALRLKNATDEMRRWSDYRYTILSTTPTEDHRQFRAIMDAERCLSARLNLKIENEH
jgi:guanylate kinase